MVPGKQNVYYDKGLRESRKSHTETKFGDCSGHSGSGKKAIIKNIALKYRSQCWFVHSVNKVTDIIDAFQLNSVLENQTLFVLNDPIGKESFDEKAYAPWKKHEECLRACFKNIKILLSCRKCVQSDKRAKGLFKDISIIVDIDNCKLSDDEKIQILKTYNANNYVFSETDLKEILNTGAYFRYCVKYFLAIWKDKRMEKNFFKNPLRKLRRI